VSPLRVAPAWKNKISRRWRWRNAIVATPLASTVGLADNQGSVYLRKIRNPLPTRWSAFGPIKRKYDDWGRTDWPVSAVSTPGVRWGNRWKAPFIRSRLGPHSVRRGDPYPFLAFFDPSPARSDPSLPTRYDPMRGDRFPPSGSGQPISV